jgi:hypothetical protein
MAKATKSKAAKAKAKSKAAKAKSKAAKPKSKAAKPQAKQKTVQKPIVCFVTPTSQNAKSIKAFEALIDDLQDTKIDWQVFSANGSNDSAVLDGLAQQARDYVVSHQGTPPNQVPAVIVAGGTLAASKVQKYTNTIPIVQAAGGSKPSNAGANTTGFYLNAPPPAKTICQEQYDLLNTSINTPAIEH